MGIRETLLTRRWSIAVALAIVTAVLLVATIVSRWTHDVLFDTDSWTETVGPIGTDPVVIDPLSDRVSTAIIDWLDADARLDEVLPQALRPLAGLIATQLNEFVEEETRAFFDSQLYEDIWISLNRTVHAAAVAVIRDEIPLTSVEDGVVTIDITPIVMPIVDGVFERLTSLGEAVPDALLNQVDFDEGINDVIQTYEVEGLPGRFTQVEVYSSDRLSAIQSGTALLDRLVWVLPVLLVLALAGALYWAPNRLRQSGVLAALGALAMLGSFLAVNLILGQIVGSIQDSGTASVAEEVFDGITGGLEGLLMVLVIVGIVGAAGVFGWTAYNSYQKRRA